MWTFKNVCTNESLSFLNVVVWLLSRVLLFATPWTAACQSDLSITISQSLLKLMSIESLIPSNHLVLCHPLLLLPSVFRGLFLMSRLLISGGQSIGVPASASVLPMNIQDWFPLGWTGWISIFSWKKKITLADLWMMFYLISFLSLENYFIISYKIKFNLHSSL